jgi:hypothetical protein
VVYLWDIWRIPFMQLLMLRTMLINQKTLAYNFSKPANEEF